jgi:hypothetical protein
MIGRALPSWIRSLRTAASADIMAFRQTQTPGVKDFGARPTFLTFRLRPPERGSLRPEIFFGTLWRHGEMLGEKRWFSGVSHALRLIDTMAR